MMKAAVKYIALNYKWVFKNIKYTHHLFVINFINLFSILFSGSSINKQNPIELIIVIVKFPI